jgi:hypothetical protein
MKWNVYPVQVHACMYTFYLFSRVFRQHKVSIHGVLGPGAYARICGVCIYGLLMDISSGRTKCIKIFEMPDWSNSRVIPGSIRYPISLNTYKLAITPHPTSLSYPHQILTSSHMTPNTRDINHAARRETALQCASAPAQTSASLSCPERGSRA